MSADPRPLARRAGLLVRRLDDETLVYDSSSFHVHCLNPNAARVWEWCDGMTSIAEMVGRLDANVDRATGEDVVWIALDELEQASLLEPPPLSRPSPASPRREALRRLGSGLAIPAILSIMTPTIAEAASCVTPANCGSVPVCSQPSCCNNRPCCNSGTQTCRPSGAVGPTCGCR